MALTDRRVIELAFSVNNGQLSTRVTQSTNDLQRLGREGAAAGAAVAGGVERINVAVGGLGPRLAQARTALLSFFAVQQASQLARELIGLADAYNNVRGRLTVALQGQLDVNEAFDTAFQIAQRARVPLEAIADLYGKTSIAAKQLGKDQAEVARFTELIAKSLTISGATQAEAAGALTQLNQALQSGVLRGEEFNAVNEQGGRIMQALADGLGVARGQLKGLATDGKLTADVVFDALSGQADAINREFDQLPVTVNAALTKLKNAFLRFTGEGDQGVGVTRGLSAAISTLADNIEILTPIIEIALVGGLLKAAAAGLKYIQVSRAKASAAKQEAAATAAAAAEAQRQAQIETAAAELRARAQLRSAQAAVAANQAQRAALREQIIAQNAALSAAIRAGQANEQYAVSLRNSIAGLNQQAIAAKANSVALGQQALAAERAVQATVAQAAASKAAVAGVSLLDRAFGLLGATVNKLFLLFIAVEIGKFIAEQFEGGRLAIIAVDAALQKLAATAVLAAEAIKAPFTDDTIDAAFERYEQKIQEIDDAQFELFQKELEQSKNRELEKKLKAEADAAGVTVEQLKNVGTGLVKLQADYGKLTEAAEKNTKALQAQRKADQERAESLTQIIELGGDEVQILQARAAAAAADVKSSAALADAKAEEARLAEEALEKIREELSGKQELTDAQQQAIADAERNAEAKRTEAEASAAVAEQARNQAAAAETAARTQRDNAAAVESLAESYEQARASTQLLEEAQRLGNATAEEVTAARRREAQALAEYRDALQDAADAAQQSLTVRERETDAVDRSFNVKIAEAQAAERVAQATNDETGARNARLRILRLEAQQSAALAEARRQEAAAADALAQKLRELAEADGEVTVAEAEAIARAEESAATKREQAQIADANARAKRAEAAATQETTETIREAAAATEELAEEQREAAKAAADNAAATGFVNQALDNIRARLGEVSQAAVEAFDQRLTGGAQAAGAEIATLDERIQHANNEILRLRAVESSASSGVFTQIAAFYSRVADEVELSALRQQAALEQLARQAESGSRSALNQLLAAGTGAERLRERFDLVDQSTLDNIVDQVRQLRGEIDQSADRVTALRERLAQLRGDEIEVQQLRNQRAILDLQNELIAAKARGNAEEIRNLEEALRLQRQINDEELKRIKAREEERRRDRDDRRERERDTEPETRRPIGGNLPDNVQPISRNILPVIQPDKETERLNKLKEVEIEKRMRLLDERERDLNRRQTDLGKGATAALAEELAQQIDRKQRLRA